MSVVQQDLSRSLGTLLYFTSGIASLSFGQQTVMMEIISFVFCSSITQELFFNNYRWPKEHLMQYILCHKTIPSLTSLWRLHNGVKTKRSLLRSLYLHVMRLSWTMYGGRYFWSICLPMDFRTKQLFFFSYKIYIALFLNFYLFIYYCHLYIPWTWCLKFWK